LQEFSNDSFLELSDELEILQDALRGHPMHRILCGIAEETTMKPERQVMLNGPAGRLEGLFRDGGQRGESVLILHPHPLYGGNMNNKVVFAMAKALGEAGLNTLRLNFRGVGLSEGEYDDGQGEQNDLRCALDFLASEMPGGRLYLAGFSFGAWLTLKVGGEDDRIRAMLAVGTPAGWGDMDWLRPCTKPKLLIHGSADEYCDPGRLGEEFRRLSEPKRLIWVEGADHFFTEKVNELNSALAENLGLILD